MSAPSSTVSLVAPALPVTTVFTPPSFCNKFVNYDDWYETSRLTSCLPSFSLERVDYFSSAFYSPAICPAGYTVDCSRLNTNQGPSVEVGETAVICCPSSFKCHLSVGYLGCVSRSKSSTITALSVQIRWQSSDLSLFQTPPLQTGLPSSSRHLGWTPESSLTYPYTIPADCYDISDTFLPYSKKSCNPLTGAYYSPAICPSGWTAATTLASDDFTGTSDGFNGPPIELDEIAALCCPSGMSRLPGICGYDSCVSATLATTSSALSLGLLRVRDGLQIRWASSDMTVLETHPLTPGLKLPRETVTIIPVASPEGLYKAGIAIAILPLLFSLVAVVLGALLLRVKQNVVQRRNDARECQPWKRFKPAIFSLAIFIPLICFVVTSIILLELSCHILPSTDTPSGFPSLSIEEFPSAKVAARQVGSNNLTSSSPFELTCQYIDTSSALASISVRRVRMLSTAEDARVDFATTTSSTTYEYGLQTTIACSSSNTPVKIPECNPGAGAPRAEEWLASQQRGEGLIKLEGSADGAFFLANMLPTFLASFFSIPWKIMELQAATLEPFRQVTRGSMALRSILGNYQEFHALKAPLPLLTTCLVYGSAAITALSSEGWQLELVGTCGEFDNEGCVPIMQVVPKVVRALQIMLAIVALLAFVLAFYSRRTRLDVYADPRSILGIATLTQSPDVRNIFRNLEPTASIETLKSRIGHTRLKLGTDPTTRGHGFQLSEPPQLYSDKEESPAHMSQRPMARLMLLLSLFILFLAALTIVTIYYIVTSNEDGFERFMSGQGFGPRFIFAICGVIVNLGWVSIFQLIIRLLPYYAMQPLASPAQSILLPYSSDHFSSLASGIRTSNPRLAIIALSVVLSEFLPLLLANVPFDRTTTWNAHIVSSWTAVAVLGLMIIVMIAVMIMLFRKRPKYYLNVELLTKAPLAAILMLVSRSEDFVLYWRGYATLSGKERDAQVVRKDIMCGLSGASGVDGSVHPIIHVIERD